MARQYIIIPTILRGEFVNSFGSAGDFDLSFGYDSIPVNDPGFDLSLNTPLLNSFLNTDVPDSSIFESTISGFSDFVNNAFLETTNFREETIQYLSDKPYLSLGIRHSPSALFTASVLPHFDDIRNIINPPASSRLAQNLPFSVWRDGIDAALRGNSAAADFYLKEKVITLFKGIPGGAKVLGPLSTFAAAAPIFLAKDSAKEAFNQSASGAVGLAGTGATALLAGAVTGVGASIGIVVAGGILSVGAAVAVGYYLGQHINSDQTGAQGFSDGLLDATNSVLNFVGYYDPIVLDLNQNNNIDLISLNDSRTFFDMKVNGMLQRTSWVENGDGILVLDKNGNGQIDDLSEIFSEKYQEGVTGGIDSLGSLDSNNDGVINAQDERFGEIKVWIDSNSDAIVQTGELRTLSELGITEISLNREFNGLIDETGSIIVSDISVRMNDGTEILASEVALLSSNSDFTRESETDGISYYVAEDGSRLGVGNSLSGDNVSVSSQNAGVYLFGRGDDTINVTGSGDVSIALGAGNDSLAGSAGNEEISGDAGADNISAAGGDDIISGGQGNDTINGGAGMDTAIYGGDRDDFTVTENTNGTWTVTDTRSDADINLGTDTLTGIERIRFDDQVIHTDGTNNNPIIVGGQMTVRGNAALSITSAELLGTAVDEDGDYLTVVRIGNVVGGSASIDKDGNVVFTPTAGFTGNASFDYTVDDSHGGVATGTAEITVLPALPTDNFFDDQWYLKAINAIAVWDDYTGRGVSVGILDDGITAHPDLDVNPATDIVRMGYVDETSEPFLAAEGEHGTFLGGLIAGQRNGEGIVGVAYGASLTAYIAYGDTAFDRQEEVDVSNNSWMYNPGSSPTIYSGQNYGHLTNELEDAVENGRDGKGTVIVSTAGNARGTGENTNYFELMNSRFSITVGAADSLGRFLPFSTPGANILVVAPGSDITSTDIVGQGGYSDGTTGNTTYGADYFNGQGTSFSTPIVAGVAALILEANPDLGWRDVKEILAYSAVNSDATYTGWRANAANNWNGGGLHYSHDYGFGMVDALAAVRLAETWGNRAATSANEILVSEENTVSQTVPNNEEGIFSQIEITSGVRIDQIEVELDMLDTDLRDLQVTLISPDGTHSILIDGASSRGNNVARWTLSSGHFIGELGVGVWTLHIVDPDSGDRAVLNSWRLNLYGDAITSDDVYIYTNEFGRFIEAAYETRGILTDDEGTDTLNAAAVTTDTKIDLRDDETSLIAGRELQVAEGTVIENVYTGDGDDSITGNDANNALYGGRGDDILAGGLGADILDGGLGNDIADYSDSNAGVTIDLANNRASGGHAQGDSLQNIEGVIGSDYADSITGDGNDNMLVGGDGNDTLIGGAGNDDLVGGDGNDILSGGAGADTIFVGDGNDTVDGGDGSDIVVFDGLRAEYTISGNRVTHNATNQVNTLSNVELLRFSDGDVAVGGNAAPTVSSTTTLNVNEDATTTITVASLLGNVSDSDNDTLTFTGVGDTNNGTVALDANGNITFTPDENFAGNARFEYTVSDGRGGAATGVVNVVVAQVNDAPEARNSMASAPSNVSVIRGTLSADDIDNTYGDLTFAAHQTNGGAANGTVVINSNGTYSYTPDENFTGTDEFSFTVTDPSGETSTGTVYVEVKGTPQLNTTFQLNANPRFVGVATINDIVQPTITTLATGGFVAAWKASLSGDDGYEIYARRFDEGGNPAGQEFRVNTTTRNNQETPHIIAMNDGGFIVTWTSHDQDGSLEGVYAQRYDANGNTVSDETLINTTVHNSQKLPVTAGLADGSFVVVWQSNNVENGYGIFAKKYNPNGTVAREEFEVNSYQPDTQDLAQVKATPDGGFIVVWESLGQDGDNYGVYGQRFDRFANKLGDEFRVNDGVNFGQGRPDIAVLNDGTFVVTWFDGDSTPTPGGSGDITMRHFNALGEPLTGEIRVNDNDYVGLQQYSTITTLANGGFVVVWESHTGTFDQTSGAYSSGSSGAIHAQVYDKYSNEVGDMMTIESFSSSYSWRPEVTALDEGGFVVMWQAPGTGNAVNMYSKIVGTSISTTYAPMYLVGTSGDDVQIAGDADDQLYGGAGDDTMDGGAGDDTAVYWRTRDQYEVSQNSNGTWTVTAIDDGAEGSDTLANIEHIRFADQFLTIGTQRAANNDTLRVNEDHALVIDTNIAANTAVSAVTTSNASHGTVVVNDDLTITYVPNRNYNGSDSFTVTVAGQARTVNITVAAQNDAPILSVDESSTNVNASVDIDVLAGASDVDNNTLTISQLGNPAHGSVQIVNGVVRYTPNTGFRGFDRFEYNVSDGQGAVSTKTLTVNVGRADVSTDLSDAQYNIDQAFNYSFSSNSFITTFATVYYNGNVTNVGTLTYSATLADGSALPSWLTFDATNRTLSGTATTDDVSGLQIIITATDGTNSINSDIIHLTSNAILGDTGNDTLEGTSANNYIFGDTGNDTIEGQAGDDYLDGGIGHDVIEGGDGNDILRGGQGIDVLKGGAGNDDIDGGNGIDELNYEDEDRGVRVDLARGYAVGGTSGIDTLSAIENVLGSSYDDLILGNDADNTLFGGRGDDVLRGQGGDDILFSDEGEDQMYGGAGNDVLMAASGAEIIDGGEGVDTVDYSHPFNQGGVYVNLQTGRGYIGVAEGDSYINIEDAVGTNDDDILVGNAGDNTLFGLAGNDVLDGGAGNDTLIGGSGWDRLIGGGGNDRFVVSIDPGSVTEVIDFTTGSDKIDYRFININAANGVLDIYRTGNDTLIHFNNRHIVIIRGVLPNQLSLSDFAFSAGSNVTELNPVSSFDATGLTLTGDGEDNRIDGSVFDDTIRGGDGDDTLVGLGGNDTIYGEAGNDIIQGNSGADTIDGGAGNDVASYSNSHAAVNVNLSDNQPESGGSAQGDVLIGIEQIQGSKFNDILTGDSGNNVIEGGEGNDRINAKGGTDYVFGNGGDDIFIVEPSSGSVVHIQDFDIYNPAERIDLTAFGNISNIDIVSGGDDTTIIVNGQYISLIGINWAQLDLFADGTPFILAEGSNPTFTIQNQIYGTAADGVRYGTNQNNTVSGTGTTAELFVDGRGSDTIYLNQQANFIDTWHVSKHAGDVDTVYNYKSLSGTQSTIYQHRTFSTTYTLGPVNYTLSAAKRIDLSEFADIRNFNDLLSRVSVSGGNTYINLGSGQQIVLQGYAHGTSSNTTETLANLTTAGLLSVGISIGAPADWLWTPTQTTNINYSLVGSNFTFYNGTLNGTLADDNLEGGYGVDQINGYDGDDYINAQGGDDVINAGAGNDTVYGGAGNDTINAGSGDDTIYGGDGNDTINAGSGDDVIRDGSGSDTMIGGQGTDRFIITASAGATDTITDFEFWKLSEQIDLTAFDGQFANYAALRAAMTQDNDDVHINLGNNQTLVLEDTRIEYLAKESFIGNVANNTAPTIAGSINPGTEAIRPQSQWELSIPNTLFSDADGDFLDITATLANGSPLPGWMHFDADSMTFSGTPQTGDVGSHAIRVTASDGSAAVYTDFSVNVEGLLSATNLRQNIQYTEDTPFTFTPIVVSSLTETAATVTLTLSDTNAGTLNTGTSNNVTSTFTNGVWQATGAIADINTLLANLVFTPASNAHGSFNLGVSISDGENDDISTSMSATGISVNDIATVASSVVAASTSEDTAVNITPPAVTDIEDGTITLTSGNVTFSNVTNGASVSVNSDGTIRYQAAPNANGTDSFTYRVTDSDGGQTQPVTVNVTIAAVNDAPELVNPIATQQGREESAFSYTLPANTFTDVDGDTITYSATLVNDTPLPSWLSFNAQTREFSGTPPRGTQGVVNIKVIASDGTTSTPATFSIDLATGTAYIGQTITGFDPYEQITYQQIDSDNVESFEVVDFNGDGSLDVVGDYGSLGFWLYNQGGGTYTRLFTNNVVSFEVTDFNGNGTQDIVANFGNGIGIYSLDYATTPVTQTALAAYNNIADFVVTDFNGDGVRDLVIQVVAGDGTELISHVQGSSINHIVSGEHAEQFEVVDVNNDGEDDIVAELGGNLGLYFIGNSSGNASTRQIQIMYQGSATGVVTSYFAVGDVIAGGSKEIVFAFDNGVYMDEGNATARLLNASVTFGSISEVAIADFDGDGDIDIVAARAGGGYAFFYQDSGNFTIGTITTASYVLSDIQFADWNGDGNIDMIANRSGVGLSAYDFENSSWQTILGQVVSSYELVDFNNDGYLDIMVDADSNGVRLYEYSGRDTLTGTDLDDTIYGRGGDDTINGGDGWDTLYGEAGNDVINGGSGNDRLLGGTGHNIMTGGNGYDVFVIERQYSATYDATQNRYSGNFDVILDFDPSVTGERIDISAFEHVTSLTHLTARSVTIDGVASSLISIANPNDASAVDVIILKGYTGSLDASDFLFYNNNAPVLTTPMSDLAVGVGQEFSYNLPTNTFIDPDGDTITYRYTFNGTPPSGYSGWINYDEATGRLYGTPTAADIGVANLRLIASDGALSGIDDFTITINSTLSITHTNQTISYTEDNGAVDLTNMVVSSAAAAVTVTLVLSNPGAGAFNTPTDQSVASSYNAANGTWTVTGGVASVNNILAALAFTPASNFNGNFTIAVNASDSFNTAVSDTISVTGTAVNDAPTASGIANQSVNEGSLLDFTIPANSFNDVDGDSLTYTATLNNGSALPSWLTFNGSTLTGTPANGDVGNLSVRIRATDPSGAYADNTFTLTVVNVNNAPTTVGALPSQTVNEDQSALLLSASVVQNAFRDVDAGDSLTYSLRLNGSAAPSWLTINGSTGQVNAVNPPNAAVGSYDISVIATDSAGATAQQTFALNVHNVNDAPTAISLDNVSIDENVAGGIIGDIAVIDVDLGDTHTFSVSDDRFEVVNNQLKLREGQSLNYETTNSVTLDITATDSGNASVTQQFVINVIDVNEAPTANNITASLNEDNNYVISTSDLLAQSSANDVDGNLITVTSVQNAVNGTVSMANDVITFVPAANYNGTASFTYTLSDGNGGVVTRTASLTVNAVNDAPTANDISASVHEDTNYVISISDLLEESAASDIDSDTLTIASVQNASNGSVSLANGSITFVPTADYNGAASFTYTVSDGDGGTVTRTANLTVSAGNDAPTVQNVTATLNEDNNYVISVANLLVQSSANDIDGDSLAVTSVQDATHGVVTMENGSITFVPTANYNGTASFTYTVSDGNGGVVTRTANLTVDAVNDAPTAQDITATINEDNNYVISTSDLLTQSSASDVDGDTLTVTSVQNASGGSVAVADGTITFVPTANYNGAASFTYTVSDGNGGTVTRTASLTVNPVNDAPTAQNITATINEDNDYVISAANLLTQSSANDIDGDTLTIASVQNAINGTVSLENGNVTFTPAANYNGTASFTYTVSDGNGGTATQTANLTVSAVNDAPTVDNINASIDEDNNYVVSVSGLLTQSSASDVDGDTLIVTSVQNATNGTVSMANGNITFVPTANYNGAASFTYTVSDGNGGIVTRTADLTINAVNDAPTAQDITATINEDNNYVISAANLLTQSSASDVDGDTLTVTSVQNATNGTVSIENGTITFVPTANYNGAASFTYTVSDGNGGTVTQTANLTINAVNDAPTANNITAAINEDNNYVISAANLLTQSSASDIDGDTLFVASVQNATNGTVSMANGNITFVPTANYNGEASFTYTVSDGNGGVVMRTANLTINAVNDAPTAQNITASVNEDNNYVISVANLLTQSSASDVDSDTLTVASVQNATNGTVSMANGNITFVPTANYNGAASFTYTVSDGNGGTVTRTTNLTVDPVNDAPTADNIAASVNEDNNYVISISDLLSQSSADDIDGDTLTIASVQNATNGTVSMANGNITFAPTNHYNGTASFTYTVSDGNGGTVTRTANLTVNPVNDAPDANHVNVWTNEDQNYVVSTSDLLSLSSAYDVDGDTLSITSVQNATNGTVSMVNGNITFVPTANYNGAASFTYTVSDGNGGTVTRTANLTVDPVNDAPTAQNITATIDEDNNYVISAANLVSQSSASDVDGDTLTVASVQNATNGTVSIENGTITFVPTANYNGTVSFTYTLSDGNGGTVTQTANLTVNAVNDAPTADNVTVSINEDNNYVIDIPNLLVQSAANDVDGDTLTVASVQNATNGSVSMTNGTITFVPTANYNGAASFTYTVSDGNGGTVTRTANLTVDPVNDAPTANNINASTNEDNSYVVSTANLLAQSSANDIDGDTLTVISVQNATNGIVSLANSTITFVPVANYNGTASFTYTVSDGNGGTVTRTANLTVDPVNDAPTANNITASINEDNSYVFSTANLLTQSAANDIDGDTLTVISVQNATNGTVSMANNNITFVPAANYNGAASFTYTVSDGNGGTVTRTANLTVDPVNDAPTADNITASINEDNNYVISISGLLAQSSANDIDGNTLTVSSVQNATNGTVSIANGNIIFVPDANYNGDASFTYTVSDSNGGTVTQTANLTINSVNDAPVVANTLADQDVTRNNPFSISLPSNLFYDVDGNTLSYAVSLADGSALPSELAYDSATSVLSGTLHDAGTVSIRVTASDGQESAQQTFTINVASNIISGTSDNDTLEGGSLNDEIYGSTGDDTVTGSDGDDVIFGEDGGDTLIGNGGDDTLYGGDGNDYILGSLGNDELHGGNGNDDLRGSYGYDTIFGDAGDDSLRGGSGNDTLNGGDGNDTLDGGDGDDTLTASDGDDILSGGSGNDTLYAGEGNDTLFGGEGDDLLAGEAGDDTMFGGQGNDRIFGGNGDDDISGNGDNDILYGGNGNDIIRGQTGDDLILGGDGNDVLYGGGDQDIIAGGAGDDIIYAGSGNDLILGEDGNDIIHAVSGNNSITGGLGLDNMFGGTGRDIFIFTALNESSDATGVDVITDFVRGQDIIDLSDMADDGITQFSDLTISNDGTNTRISAVDHDFDIDLAGVYSLDNSDFNWG